MKSDRLSKILIIAFLGALALYIISFSYIQNRRASNGPWQVVFLTDYEARPGLIVKNSKLEISQKIVFSNEKLGQTNLVRPFVFDDPIKTNIPFGEIIFQDLTFLPGTVTLNLFGHEVELLPRVLTIDKQEHIWKTGEVIPVSGPGKFQPRQEK